MAKKYLLPEETKYVVQQFSDENDTWIRPNRGRTNYAQLSWASRRAQKLSNKCEGKHLFRVADLEGNSVFVTAVQLSLFAAAA